VNVSTPRSSSNVIAPSSASSFLTTRVELLVDVAVFGLAFAVRLWFNFVSNVPNVCLAGDASEYVRIAQGLNTAFHLPLQFWVDTIFNTAAHPQTASANPPQLAQLHEMSRSGYIFPLFLLLAFAAGGNAPDSAHWQIPVGVQCLATAASCTVISKIALQLWDKKTAVTAGVLAALYPGFVVNSGRLYSDLFAETLCCVALLVSTNILIKRKSNIWLSLLLGALLPAITMTRSVLLVAIPIFVLPLFWLERKDGIKAFAAVAAGAAAVVFPWLVLQKAALGTVSLIVDRGGRYNLFVGVTADSQGWLSFPAPYLVNIESVPPLKIVIDAFNHGREGFIKLLLDKPARFLATPCNDFKAPIGVASCWLQTVLHQVILTFSALGLLTSLFDTREYRDERKERARLLLIAFFLAHAPYLLFVTMSRYALTSMPVVILFGAAGITALSSAPAARRGKRFLSWSSIAVASVVVLLMVVKQNWAELFLSKCSALPLWLAFGIQGLLRGVPLAMAIYATLQLALQQNLPGKRTKLLAMTMAVLVLPELVLPLRAYSRYGEYPIAFDQPGQHVLECIPVDGAPERALRSGAAYVMVNIENGEHLRDDIAVSINGVKLNGPFIPAMSLAQSLPSAVKIATSEFRLEAEWILTDMLHGFGDLSLLKVRDTYLIPVSAFELKEALKKDNHLFALTVEKLNDAQNTLYSGHYIKSGEDKNATLLLPSVSIFSWEKGSYGMERTDTMNDPALDQKVTVKRVDGKQVNVHDTFIRLLVAESGGDKPNVTHFALAAEHWNSPLPSEITQIVNVFAPKTSPSSVQVIRLTGTLNVTRKQAENAHLRIDAIYKQADGSLISQQSSWVPRLLTSSGKTTHLDYTLPVWLSKTSQLRQVKVTFYDLTAYTAVPENCEVQIIELPSNPVISTHQFF
jgi:4-amino-4-deoxy-L-arabinose transferase-like glycosyltransferase